MDANRVRSVYRWMAPVYDPLFRRLYASVRRESITRLALGPADVVAVIGAGTGLDLLLLKGVRHAVAIDLSPGMLHRAAKKRSTAALVIADGARLPLRDGSVDAVVLHLVLSVAPDPRALFADSVRVLKDDGRIAILDHFAPPGATPGWRRVASRLPWLVGTHFDRRFEVIATGHPVTIVADRRYARGIYRSLLLSKHAATTLGNRVSGGDAATEIPSQHRASSPENG